ncbi:hypothetical protein [Janthinobacterium sp. PC23-8]|uniref:hypothetical protein n=1 Tax=Janthinobacterium sp. PC23-8 TaxID=2012679 RepID=UPI001595A19E|nr:hypothetical protein [Janthinobacterium sp. PC23-8]
MSTGYVPPATSPHAPPSESALPGAPSFKGCNALKKTIDPTRVPIKEKESYRWLENLRQSTELFSTPERCVHIGDREIDLLDCLLKDSKRSRVQLPPSRYLEKIAQPGGYLASDNDHRETSSCGVRKIWVIESFVPPSGPGRAELDAIERDGRSQ